MSNAKLLRLRGPGPGSGANQETESADDFVLDTYTFINSATFTGLIPADASLSDVAEVRVEIYRVFPKDSDVTRTPRVPTRENSPSDVEFDDRDSGSSNLTFAMTLQLVPCSGPVSGGSWKNHGAYVSSFSHIAESFVEQGLISEEEADALVAAAAQSSCGAKAK